jgi:hypothetical protein
MRGNPRSLAISRNPFGVYVDSFTWRRDPNVGAADEAAPS